MSALAFIWWSSLLLAGTAIATTVALVLVRLVTTHQRARWALRRRELVRRLLGGQAEAREALRRLPPALVAETFVELIRLVRGEERNRFVAQAAEFGVPQQLARQVRRGSARARLRAAHGLAQFGDDDSVAALRSAVGDGSSKVRLAAALSLAEGGHADDLQELVRDLRLGAEETSGLVVTIFQSALAGGTEDIKAMILAPETHPGVRTAAIEALVSSGDYSVVPMITELALASPADTAELPQYLRALGLIGHPAARPAVVEGLAAESFAVRAAAAEAAGRIGLRDAADRLADLLDDPEWWVRFRAGEAMLKLGPDGIDRLRRIAATGGPRACDAAASILAENKVPR